MSEQVVLGIVAILGACVTGLIWVIKSLFKEVLPVLRELRGSVDLNTKQTELNTKQTKANEKYLRLRNGSDGVRWEENTRALHTLTEIIKRTAKEEV